jgi:hypothetical protein
MSIDRTITISKHEVVLARLFAEDTWELAFGNNAWENGYTDEDVYHALKKYELKALAWDAMYEGHQPSNVDEDTEENYEMREKMDTYLGVTKDE